MSIKIENKGMKNMTIQPKARKKMSMTTFALIAIVAIFSVTTVVGFASLTNPSNITLTPTQFQPVRVKTAWFDVKTLDGSLLKTIDGMSSIKYFTDQTYKYPKVDIFYSQPFASDSAGTPVLTPGSQHQVTDQFIVKGKAYFLTTYYMSMDIGARTYSNMPLIKDTTSYLSPWQNKHYVYAAPLCYGDFSYDFTLAKAPSVQGSLLLYADVGTAPWTFQYSAAKASIQSSLEPIDFQLSPWNPAPRTGYTFAEALAKCQTNYGNGRVVVQPHITIQGMSNYIRYSYTDTQTLPNGTKATITVNTQSAWVGFADSYKAPFDLSDKVGSIPNFFASQYKISGLSSTDKPVETASKTSNVYEEDKTDNKYVNTRTILGGIDITNVNDERVITGGSAVHNTYTNLNNIDSIYIDLSDPSKFTLPQELNINAEFEMQPKTSVKIANALVTYTAWFWDGAFPCFVDTTEPGQKDIQWPFAVNIENIYAVTRQTWKLQILTENSISILTATGKPVDPSLLTDFDLSEIVNNPSYDQLDTEISRDITDWNAIWSDLIAGGGTTLIIIAIIAVVVLIIFLRGKFSFGGSGGSRTNLWDYFVARTRRKNQKKP